MRRLIAAAKVSPSITVVFRLSLVLTGVSRRAIARGIVELGNPPLPSGGAIRKPGGGRQAHRRTGRDAGEGFGHLIEPLSRGDPESALRWTCKSVRKLAQELGRRGHVSATVWWLSCCTSLGYSLQANAKTLEGSSHPDRNAQFGAHPPKGPTLSQGGLSRSSRWIPRRRSWWGTLETEARELRLKGEPGTGAGA